MQRVDDIPGNNNAGQSSNIGHTLEDNGNDGDDGHRRDLNQGSGKGIEVDQVNRKDPDQCESRHIYHRLFSLLIMTRRSADHSRMRQTHGTLNALSIWHLL